MGKLPKMMIKDVLFSIDAEHRQLIEVERPDNTIAFDDLKDEGTFYTALFDVATRNLHSDFISFDAGPENVCRITIPKIVLKGFPELSAYNLKQLNQVSKEDDWGIQLTIEKQKINKKFKGGQKKGGLQ